MCEYNAFTSVKIAAVRAEKENMMADLSPSLQKIGDDKHIVRVGRRRIGEVELVNGRWYYIWHFNRSEASYETQENAVFGLIEAAYPKKDVKYPRINFRLSAERRDWFRDYAQRNGKSMSEILKEHIEQLYQQDQLPEHESSLTEC